MNLFSTPASVRTALLTIVFLASLPSHACDADEMIAQMRSTCNEMVQGYQKTVGKPLATAAALTQFAKARAHCHALEFDKAGITLAMLLKLANTTK